MEEVFYRRSEVDDLTRSAIDQECGSEKFLIPVFAWNLHLRKVEQTNFNNMSVFSFCNSVLLMSMSTGNKMRDANLINKGIEFFIFTTQLVCMERILRSKILSTRALNL
jgi:hypothetical protein